MVRDRRHLLLGVVAIAFVAIGATRPPPTVQAARAQQPGPLPISAAAPAPRFARDLDARVFLRGNLHAHSSRSDGDKTPREVYAWYREHGYAFLALTDHNKRVDPTQFRAEERPGFVILPGEEVSTIAAGLPVHVNALCARRGIGGKDFPSTPAALSWAIARVHEEGGIALVNHPNFSWAIRGADLPAARGAELLEIYSGHPGVHTAGNATRPSHEALWSAALAEGETFAGVAVDDTHHFSKKHIGRFASKPGRGWVSVYGAELAAPSICEALRRGDLVASSGPELDRLVVEGDELRVVPRASARVEFLGPGDAALADVRVAAGEPATYRLRGGERFVRARLTDAAGKQAWTQPMRVAQR